MLGLFHCAHITVEQFLTVCVGWMIAWHDIALWRHDAFHHRVGCEQFWPRDNLLANASDTLAKRGIGFANVLGAHDALSQHQPCAMK